MLHVTEPAVRSWIDRRALTVIKGSRPLAVTTRSLGEALAAVSTIRQVGEDERLLRRLLDVLDDQRTRGSLAKRIRKLGSRVPTDLNRLGEGVSPGCA